MESHPTSPEDHLPLKNETLWLLLSLHRGRRHGYGLMQEIEERSGGRVRIQTGALYRLLHRMDEDGLVEEVEPPAEETDRRRRYYGITHLGGEVLEAELARMRGLVESGVRDGVLPARDGAP